MPVDRRWLGLDRRTIAPALVVLALALLMGTVLPWINESTPTTTRSWPATSWRSGAG
ncbi:hypothetical protein P9209_04365 [Prescottella defluvii]|nr:hypothetical protein P9209_04365 [Prescottella defluvii]